MNFLDPHYQNEFLAKWIYGELTTKELNSFVNSTLYKNLVFSPLSDDDSIKES
ncbi:hypothetical protein [Aquimarina algiphila]|uniref:hypothetical protein n=1 Tax=Aquimarina algiphila TaxID=2047982 RepID=UPI00232C19CA|nr:hypothetical protein [Aquimarina algiphila]